MPLVSKTTGKTLTTTTKMTNTKEGAVPEKKSVSFHPVVRAECLEPIPPDVVHPNTAYK